MLHTPKPAAATIMRTIIVNHRTLSWFQYFIWVISSAIHDKVLTLSMIVFRVKDLGDN